MDNKPTKLKMTPFTWVGMGIGLAGLSIHSYSNHGTGQHYVGLLLLVLGLGVIINQQMRNASKDEQPNK